MRIILLCLATVAVFFSCKKNDQKTNFWECNKAQNLDSAAIHGKLIGSWVFSSRYCNHAGSFPEPGNKIKVVFDANNFTVTENATVLTQGTWGIRRTADNWRLTLSTDNEYLFGDILFCGNEVSFSATPVDGCDNNFKRGN